MFVCSSSFPFCSLLASVSFLVRQRLEAKWRETTGCCSRKTSLLAVHGGARFAAALDKEIQQPRGCTFSVSKPRTNGRWRCGWFRWSVPGEKNKHGQGVVDTSLGFTKERGMSGLSLAKKRRLAERWNGDQRGKGEERS
ncbi:hypothetical protein Peur_007000 [Populus x canadensis]